MTEENDETRMTNDEGDIFAWIADEGWAQSGRTRGHPRLEAEHPSKVHYEAGAL
jgi:hypothetical protein